MSEELISYVAEQIRSGFDRDTITGALQEKGYDEQTIEHLLIEGQKRVDTSPLPSAVIPSATNLFMGAFHVVMGRMDILGIVLAITVVSDLISLFLIESAGSKESVIVLLAGVLPILVSVFNVAILIFVYANNDQKPSYMDGVRWFGKRFFSYIWLSICVMALKMGGFLLLIVPGVILSVYTLLVLPVLAAEDLRGFVAIMRSRQLVKGRFWKTAITMSLYSLVVLGIVVVFLGMGYIVGMNTIGIFSGETVTTSFAVTTALSVVGGIVKIALSALGIGIITHLYKVYSQAIPVPTEIKYVKLKYIIITWVGVLIIPVAIILAVGLSSLQTAQDKGQRSMIDITIANMHATAELYAGYGENGEFVYTGTCDVLEEGILALASYEVMTDCNDSDEAYAFGVLLPDDTYTCVDSSGFYGEGEKLDGQSTSCQ